MKNIIFLNNAFSFELLENEEANENSIWLYFPTTAAASQVLHVWTGWTERTFDLEANAEIKFELPSATWASDDDTRIYLTNAGGESEAINIYFPENLQTSAAVEQVDETHFKVQGQRDEEQELRAQVLAYTNAREYKIPEGIRQRIAEIKFTTSRDTVTGIFNATIALEASEIPEGEEETAEIHVRYNNEYDALFIPTQTIKNGKYIITIHYPLLQINQNEVNLIQLYLRTSGGLVTIPQQCVKASILASGILDTNKFTGELEANDIVAIIDIAGSKIELYGINEAYDESRINPLKPDGELTASVNIIELENGVELYDIIDRAAFGKALSTLTWDEVKAYTWASVLQNYHWGGGNS